MTQALYAAGAPAPVQIKSLTPAAMAKWDEFVARHPGATFFHRAGWRDVLEQAFGHDAHYFYAETDGRIEGILPLGHIRSRLFGNALISTPFCVYGGIVADTEAARSALDQSACELARRLGVDHLELRNLSASHSGRPTKDLYVTFRKAIDPDSEKNMLAIPRKQRAMVRKGISAGLASTIDDHLDGFYDTYAASVHRLGTPVFARKYFETLRKVFGPDCEVLTVAHDGRAVASVMNFYFRDEVLPYYGGGTHAARDVAANDFMYWEVMRRAAERGLRTFDYGRSKQGTGAYSFKKNWGFEPQPLPYEYVLVKGRAVPDVNPLNPKYRLVIEAWKRMPFALSKLIGPWIARSLG
jgi:FemAB-related protein (PEP-CTERM system-associated)